MTDTTQAQTGSTEKVIEKGLKIFNTIDTKDIFIYKDKYIPVITYYYGEVALSIFIFSKEFKLTKHNISRYTAWAHNEDKLLTNIVSLSYYNAVSSIRFLLVNKDTLEIDLDYNNLESVAKVLTNLNLIYDPNIIYPWSHNHIDSTIKLATRISEVLEKFDKQQRDCGLQCFSISYLIPTLSIIKVSSVKFSEDGIVTTPYKTYEKPVFDCNIALLGKSINCFRFSQLAYKSAMSPGCYIYIDIIDNDLRLIRSAWCQRETVWTMKYGVDQTLGSWKLLDWLIGPLKEKLCYTINGIDTIFNQHNISIDRKGVIAKIKRLQSLKKVNKVAK